MASKQARPMSGVQKEKLQNLQRREQLKGLLINKFKGKYGQTNVPSSVISAQVNKFLETEPTLTESNLKRLDEIIKNCNYKAPSSACGSRQGQGAKPKIARPLSHASGRPAAVRSVVQLPTQEKLMEKEDRMSVKSYASSHISGSSHARKAREVDHSDKGSVYSWASESDRSQRRPQAPSGAITNEDDEWTAIMNFNTKLYHEEMRQEQLKSQEQKRYIKNELDRQLYEKMSVKEREKLEEKQYHALQMEHIKYLEGKEKKKVDDAKASLLDQKASRDKQMKEEKVRKKINNREERHKEKQLVEKLNYDLEEEKKMTVDKKTMQREYLQTMMRENDANRKKREDAEEEVRRSDKRSQEEYGRMLDKQDKDRVEEFKGRERRTQNLTNKMADGVIKGLNDRNIEEERKLVQHQVAKDMRDQMEEDQRKMRLKDSQKQMKEYLDKQVKEKQEKEQYEHYMNKKQAEMWQKDADEFHTEEKQTYQKIRNLNKKHADYLKQQMGENTVKRATKMNMTEFNLNRKLLEEISTKQNEEGVQEEEVY